jgi:GTPase
VPLPLIAIVGRPNVGKSSLLNRLARRRVSIVDPTPGVTRDRVSTEIEIDPPTESPRGTPPLFAELMDTGGWGVYTAEGARYNEVGADLATLTPEIEAQIQAAIDRAAIILFTVDAQSGITSLDEAIARMIREHGKSASVLPVANKVDSERWLTHGLEAAALGFGEPVCVSAENGFGARGLLETMYARIEAACGSAHPGTSDAAQPHAAIEPEIKLAIVGKRNAGKSSLVNTLAGQPRVIVSEIAGTTRDSIDVRFEMEGRSILAIDRAGLRKRKSFADDVEYYAYHRMLRAIRRADVAALLIDAAGPVSQVDQKLAQELQRQYKPTVIVVNKWDLVPPEKATPASYLEYLTRELRGLDFAPIVFISAKTGEGLRDLVAMAVNLHQQASHRETTGRINTAIKKIMGERGPSSKLGTQAKLFYTAQIGTNPPTIVMVVNEPKMFEGRYERYLLNRLRDELPYSEVPIRLIFTKRQRRELEEMKAEGRAKEHRGRGDRD